VISWEIAEQWPASADHVRDQKDQHGGGADDGTDHQEPRQANVADRTLPELMFISGEMSLLVAVTAGAGQALVVPMSDICMARDETVQAVDQGPHEVATVARPGEGVKWL
jgi:hypothetical protein